MTTVKLRFYDCRTFWNPLFFPVPTCERLPELNDPRRSDHRTKSLTGRARLLGPEQGGFLLEEFFDGFAGHGAGGAFGELLDLIGIEVEFGTDLLLDPARHDFSPPLGHSSDPVRIHRRRLTERYR